MEHVLRDMPDFLIVPDAGSNDVTQLELLHSKGIDVLILDHHIIYEKESEHAVIINPQLCLDTYPNENLAAGGITYKFLQSLDTNFSLNDADNYLDLVAVSTVADGMKVYEPESRYYIQKGLKNIKNPFLKQLMIKNAEWTEEASAQIVSFNLVNFINANIRVGSIEDKETMFRALLSEEDTTTRISKYRGVEREVTETLAEQAYRLCVNSRGRQNRRRTKLMEEAMNKINSENLANSPVVVVTLEDVPSGFSGLIAGAIASSFQRPAVVLSWIDDIGRYGGSLRGFESGSIKDTKEFLDSLNVFHSIRGHANASGVEITNEGLGNLLEVLKSDKLKLSLEQDSLIPVDFIISPNNVNGKLIEGFAKYDHLWGKGAEKPAILIKDVELRCDNITMKNMMKATLNGVELISFSVDSSIEEIAQEKGKVITVDIVGTFGVNRFMGKTTPQCVIDFITVKSVKDDSFGGFVF